MESNSLGRSFRKTAVAALLFVLVLGASGCATKKYVRTQIDPVNQQVSKLDTRTQEQGQEIDELGTKISRVDERAMTAEQKAQAADQKADKARAEAAEAAEIGSNARTLAQNALNDAGALGKRIDGLHNYELASEENVLFDFESGQLNDEAKRQLDQLASKIPGNGPYAIEVKGFTDKTGGREYNLALSEKRAGSVVRYLTAKHNVPLYRVYRVGLGSEDPAEANDTREGRRMNRRVEVKVYVADRPSITARNPN